MLDTNVSSPITPVGNAVEPPQVALSLKRLVLGLLKESRHDVLTKVINVMNTKRSIVNPRDNICEAFGFSGIQNDVKLPRKGIFVFGADLGVVLKDEGKFLVAIGG